MSTSWLLPPVHAKLSAPKKKKTGGPPQKYDVPAMIKDRINGMSWQDIAVKHNVRPNAPLKKRATAAWHSVWYSADVKTLTPDQVAKLT